MCVDRLGGVRGLGGVAAEPLLHCRAVDAAAKRGERLDEEREAHEMGRDNLTWYLSDGAGGYIRDGATGPSRQTTPWRN